MPKLPGSRQDQTSLASQNGLLVLKQPSLVCRMVLGLCLVVAENQRANLRAMELESFLFLSERSLISMFCNDSLALISLARPSALPGTDSLLRLFAGIVT